MKYSIRQILIFLFVLIGIIGIFFVMIISFFFYRSNINYVVQERITDLKVISNIISGPFLTLRTELYPGTIENIFRETLKNPGMVFIRIINLQTATIEKSGDEREVGTKIKHTHFPLFERDVQIHKGISKAGEPITEFTIKSRDGTNFWMGVSFENIKKDILSASIMLGGIILILLIITVLSTFLLVRKIIIKPLISLMRSFERLKNKDYNVHLYETSVVEMQRVFESFNQMVNKIKETESRLTEELKRAKELDQMKSEFISTASHQLRTPLSAVKWTLKMIIDGDLGKLNTEQKTFLMQGYQSNERMIRLINDLLNVARIEEKRFGYTFSLIQLEDLIENVSRDFIHAIDEKKIEFSFKKPSETLPKVQIDPSRMRLVLQNLIDNAIKYTHEKGRVTISVKHSKLYLEVSINDTGVGIPKNQQDRLFTKFFRGDNVIRMQTKGTGLGLFIVKNIIEKHGGKIWIESDENKGSTFYFTIPIPF